MSESGSGGEEVWRAAVSRLVKGDAPQTLAALTADGISIGPLHARSESPATAPRREVSVPVAILQRIDHPDADEANRQARVDIAAGATGLAIVLDGAVGHREAGGEDAIADFLAAVLDGLPRDRTILRFDDASAQHAAGQLAATLTPLFARAGGCAPIDLGLDPIGDLARTGRVAGGGAAMLPIMERLRASGFVGTLLRADGRPYHEAGATEAQELASVLATGVGYLRQLEPLGLDATRLSIGFTLVADADQLLSMSKLRALRQLWARVEEACGLDPVPLRLHVETARRMLSRRDPDTNLLRNAMASAAAIMGGADSLTVLPHTSADGLPDSFARRLARNTPLVLLEEAHLGRVADPADGAGAFEAATHALCGEAWRLFQEIEQGGGLRRMLEAGIWQARIAEARAARRQALLSDRTVIVGVTRFAADGGLPRPEAERADHANEGRLPSVRDAEAFETVP